jgi:hypothetical protein
MNLALIIGFLLLQSTWYLKIGHVFVNPIRRYGASLLATLASTMSLVVILMFITSKSLEELQGPTTLTLCILPIGVLLIHRIIRKRDIKSVFPKDFARYYKSHIAAVAIPSFSTLIFSIWVMKNNGDQGWDSNAYHLPISGILAFEGSNNFDPLLGLGTFTILTPYGAHALGSTLSIFFGTFLYSGLVTWIAVFSFVCFAYGTLIERRSNSDTNRLILFFPTVIWLIPSVAGQTTHFYVDAIAGVFVASTFILFSCFLYLKNPSRVYPLLIGAMGSASIAVKSQSLYPVALIGLAVVIKLAFNKKYREITLLAIPFFVLGFIPYLRNFIFFDNPIYPIRFMHFPGQISISELSSSVESFVPISWSQNLPVRIAFSLIFSPLLIMGKVIASRLGWYDVNRSDLSGFSYDSVVGGVGAPAALLFCAVIFYLTRSLSLKWNHSSVFQFVRLNSNRIIIALTILVPCLLIPGSWWVRYNLGIVLFVIFLSFLFLSNIKIKSINQVLIAVPLVVAFLLQATLLSAYTLKYERTASNSSSVDFNPEFGLTQNKKLANLSCNRMIFVEPRPTFTSAYWSLNCKKFVWIQHPERYSFIAGDYVVMNPTVFTNFKSNFVGKYQSTAVNAWFDANGTYGSFLIRIIEANDNKN